MVRRFPANLNCGGAGNMPGRWNPRWRDFISQNPNAEAKEIYQFAGKVLDEFGLSHLPIAHTERAA